MEKKLTPEKEPEPKTKDPKTPKFDYVAYAEVHIKQHKKAMELARKVS